MKCRDPLLDVFEYDWRVKVSESGYLTLYEVDGDADDEGRPITRHTTVLEGTFVRGNGPVTEQERAIGRMILALPEIVPLLVGLEDAVKDGTVQLHKTLKQALNKALGIAREGNDYWLRYQHALPDDESGE